jgi:hypothetical protein
MSGDCLADHGVEGVVHATEVDGMAHMGARRAVSEDLLKKPYEQRQWQPEAW